MAETWTAAERRALAAEIGSGGTPACPACGGALARHDVAPKRELPYVRRRLLLICTRCKRSASVDVPREAGGHAAGE